MLRTKLCAMSYRFSPVIPAHMRDSMPERDRDDSKPHIVLRHNKPHCTYSRSTMAYTVCSILASAAFIAAGVPFLAMGEEMAWWLFATFPIGGGCLGLLVLIWRGAKDEESRKKTQWQAVFGMVASIGIPRFAYFIHPALAGSAFLRDPITLGSIGFLCFLAGSGMAPGIMRWWDKDAAKLGYKQAKKWQSEIDKEADKEDKTPRV